MEIATTPEATMTTKQTTDWTNYIRMTDDEFEVLRRAGVQDWRIENMKVTRDRYDVEHAA